MSFAIEQYRPEHAAAWDAFVRGSRNGTVFHTRQFLAYHPADRFTDASLILKDGDTIVGVLSAALKDGMLVAHPGASYGGLVLGTDASVTDTGAMIDAVLAHAKAQGNRGLSMLRLPPASLQKNYAEDQQYWLYQKGFRLTRCEMDGAIDLTGLTPETVPASLTGKCRNMIKQAERAGIEVRLSNDFAGYWPLLEGVLEGRHGANPTHTALEIQKLHTLLPDGFRLLAAYKDGAMVGGIVLVTIHDQALYTLYMAQEYAFQQYHPMHLLVLEAIKLGLKEKRRVLHLGVSTEDGGTKVNEGLFFFKESFGCKPVRRESWEFTFNQ